MNWLIKIWSFWLQRHRGRIPQANPSEPHILVIRRNRLGDMIYTLPLLHALRRHYPKAHIAVACDPKGEPIARACAAVNEVIVLQTTGIRWLEISRNAARLQDFDWVIAAKGGYSRSLALLTRLTNGPVRIGFAPEHGDASLYYTDLVPPPPNPHEEHQIETLLRLIQPLNIKKVPFINLSLNLPQEAHDYALGILAMPPFVATHPFLLINLSSTVRLRFREEDFAELITRLLDATQLIIGLVSLPEDQPKAIALATRMASERVVVLATPGPLEVAALIQRAALLLTPEGGSAHLAATVKTPALVLWSEGPFGKWHSRADNHAYVQAAHNEKVIPVERVWAALQPMIAGR